MAKPDKPRVGFVGVGLMGHGMAKNILEQGDPLQVLGRRNKKPVRRGTKQAYTIALAQGREAQNLARVIDAVAELNGVKLHQHKLP
jgi:3-hydroxyisobutyrate dehydrogenase-like beta-hydroxyacid dehydrogenase